MTPRLRVLIVDDEPLAREGIRLRLEGHDDVEVVGAIGRAAEAVAAIRRLAPDILFLDVQMPGMSGFEVLRKIGVDSVPVVIFVTAHDQYALRAFRAHALDYLLKPVDDNQFREALGRARHQVSAVRDGVTARKLRALLAEAGPAAETRAMDRAEAPNRIMVKDRGRITFVSVEDIERVQAEGDYVRLYTGARSHLVRETLGDLERRLDPTRFLRVHRSTIVRLECVAEMQPYFHGEYLLITTSGARLKVSRTYRAALAAALGAKL